MFHTVVDQCTQLNNKYQEEHITETYMLLVDQFQAFMGVYQQLHNTEPIVFIYARILENWFSYYGKICTDMQKMNTIFYNLQLH